MVTKSKKERAASLSASMTWSNSRSMSKEISCVFRFHPGGDLRKWTFVSSVISTTLSKRCIIRLSKRVASTNPKLPLENWRRCLGTTQISPKQTRVSRTINHRLFQAKIITRYRRCRQAFKSLSREVSSKEWDNGLATVLSTQPQPNKSNLPHWCHQARWTHSNLSTSLALTCSNAFKSMTCSAS